MRDPANDPDELIDVVDRDDRVIGTARKGDANRDPRLWHREIAILIHRDGELLWQRRSPAKTVMPGVWDVACAGHVAAGDTPLAAAHRELREELGFDTELVFLERRLVRLANETYFAYVYAGAVREGLVPFIDPREVASIEWCDAAGCAAWRAAGRPLSPVACALAEAFWAGSWAPVGGAART